jgi:RluA family pseudouridine synthase
MSSCPQKMHFESVVRPDHKGLTLVQYLSTRFNYHTQTEWEAHLEAGRVTIAGRVAQANDAVTPGDAVIYTVDDYSEPNVPTHYETIWEDEEFLLVGKPAGAPIHSTGRIFYNTFTSVLRRVFDNEELQPMHRLDRDTSGIMLFAKTHDTASRYQKNLDRILLRKIYRVVVPGIFPEGETVCQLPLREDPAAPVRAMMKHTEDGKACHTIFNRLAVMDSERGPLSILEAELITGRKHQIRAHLFALGFPILGDRIYSFGGEYYLKMVKEPLTEEDFAVLGSHNQMLHAQRVLMRLPYENEPRWFESACYTEEMQALLEISGVL